MFKEWLIEEKGIKKKVASDYMSRLNRVQRLTGSNSISLATLNELEQNEEFKKLSRSVKSELRVTIRRYVEYLANQ